VSAALRRPESLSGVLGVGAVILVVLATGLSLLSRRTRALDPEATLASWFEPAELPFGLQPVAAARQADGEVLLRLADPAVAPEPEPIAPKKAEKPAPGAPPPRFDWSAIQVGAADTPPSEGYFVTWPLAAARGRLAGLFEQGGPPPEMGQSEPVRAVDPLAGLGPDGGRRVIGSGRIPWGEFEAPFVHERTFEAGGTFVDTLRLNLSSEREALVLFLRWPRGLPASQARAEELLAALRRRAAPAG
jgi:hypothetical protein